MRRSPPMWCATPTPSTASTATRVPRTTPKRPRTRGPGPSTGSGVTSARAEPGPVASSERFARAIAAIDAGNADDPNVVAVRSRTGPKEILHAELVSEWVERLQPDAAEALLLAARGHHYRRWTVPRASVPA